MRNLLLLSASGYKSTAYLEHAKSIVDAFLQENACRDESILFIPYAGVRRSYDEYEKKVQNGLNNPNITSIHRFNHSAEAIKKARVIMVGGGNSFMLLHKLYHYQLLDVLKEKILQDACYIGWSAGSNIAGKSIMTTNDMPIVMPVSFESLGVFPHQINPHFISGKIPNHNGESREERLEEFLIANPQDTVYAIPEGSAIWVSDDSMRIVGHEAVLKMTYPMNVETLDLHSTHVF